MRISVVMAVWNGTWCIERALDSLMEQTRRPDQILVCDDGSTDGTPELIERRYGNAVTVLRLPHRNAAVTRKVGLDHMSGDWVAFMDADDTWLPEKLERQLAFLADHPEVRMVMSDGVYIDVHGVIRDSWLADYFDPVRERVGDLFEDLTERCFTLLSSTMVEREAYASVGGLDQTLAYSYDYDLWLRVAARFPAAIMAERLTTYYSSPGALSRNIEARYRDDLVLMRRIEAGLLGERAQAQRFAAERAASIEYDLGLLCLRSGRSEEGRDRMWRALERGPLKRRALAAASLLLPAWVVGRLKRSTWLKGAVQASREPVTRVGADARLDAADAWSESEPGDRDRGAA